MINATNEAAAAAMITGRVEVSSADDGGYEFVWVGGDTVGITRELLAESQRDLLWRQGDMVGCGPFLLRVVAESPGVIVAQRAGQTMVAEGAMNSDLEERVRHVAMTRGVDPILALEQFAAAINSVAQELLKIGKQIGVVTHTQRRAFYRYAPHRFLGD